MKTIKKEITNLAFYIQQSGMTQQEVGDLLGVYQSQVAHWVRTGITTRSAYASVVGLAEALGVDPSDILEDA